MKWLFLLLIKGYQLCISPFLGSSCRFYPTCSCYAADAVGKYGSIKGGYLTLIRLLKCGPWHPGGIDEV